MTVGTTAGSVMALNAAIREASADAESATSEHDRLRAEARLEELVRERDNLQLPPLSTQAQAPARALAAAGGSSVASETDPPEDWPTLRREGLHGLAGEVVSAILPGTEADEAGLLVDFLSTFGALAGPGPHTIADAASHPARLFVTLVGKTSRGRKGTARANVARIFEAAEEDFCHSRVLSGLSTGEGLINAVSDGTRERNGNIVGIVEDKRLLVYEPEFARVLKVAARDSATLSAILRDAWDRGNLRVLTRKDPLSATGAHVCIIGHVTAEELRRNLTETEIANGLANRFLFILVRRSKRLPHGGGLSSGDVEDLAVRVRRALAVARSLGVLTRTPKANRLWEGIYGAIEDDREGLYGAVTARAEAQILRLSLTYALLDGSRSIEREHLLAGLAVWEYAEESARILFGSAFGDETSERLYRAIEGAGDDGLDTTEQFDVFGRNVKAARLEAARTYLERRNLIKCTTVKTKGRPRVVSVRVPGATLTADSSGLYSRFFVPLEEESRGQESEKGTREGEERAKEGERENHYTPPLSPSLPAPTEEPTPPADFDPTPEDAALLADLFPPEERP